MATKLRKKSRFKATEKYEFKPYESTLDFYIAETTGSYDKKRPFSIYYDVENSVRLLKGDCIETLNQARENSVDMIFADPPLFSF